ncbi:MAG TPA: phosphate signaling complex protein PhoU [Candidatus Thermoplasmatota archaeon]|nr:phosphate signaling complex protein PhoU [Candidatus Thermoplasmatota archaeon]
MSPHERRFHHDVEDLVARVAKMADLSRASVHDGVEAFAALDLEAADRVIRMNQEINRLDVEIEARALDLIALHQPMAVDLRTLGATLKVITYLDRIGRYGYDVAKATHAMEGKTHIRRLVGIPLMRDKALALLERAVTSLKTRNATLARTVQPMDDEVDGLYEQIFRECVTHMIEDPRNITPCTQYILVARHLERVGDNAGKIAEKAIYAITGERRLDLDAEPAGP